MTVRSLATLRRLPAATTGLLLLVLQGCATVPSNEPSAPSRAFAEPHTTSLGRAVSPVAREHPGLSGFRAIEGGAEAFQVRAAAAAMAERAIDAQYYIWNDDTMGRLLGAMLLQAADRGVQVRLLVDDFHVQGRDRRIARFDAHPNIEVRVFNPIGLRGPGLRRVLGFLSEFPRLNHRMHNKLFIVDGAVAVAGGRNVGDEYYGVHAQFDMRDRDLLVAGPVVAELGASFDSYWNSRWSVPLERLVSRAADAAEVQALRDTAAALAREPPPLPFAVRFTPSQLRAALQRTVDDLVWAEAEVHYDLAEPPGDASPGGNFARVRDALADFVEGARSEILIQTPYLLLRERGLALIGDLTARGVTVKLMTNSLASTDVVSAQAVYARHRPGLIARGARVFELRPDAAAHQQVGTAERRPGRRLTLHAKTIVADRRSVYVGTYNLDRRSAMLNTEIALIIHSPELARRIAGAIERDMRPENSWEVVAAQSGGSMWLDGRGGREFLEPPEAGFARRLGAGLIGILPIDDQL